MMEYLEYANKLSKYKKYLSTTISAEKTQAKKKSKNKKTS